MSIHINIDIEEQLLFKVDEKELIRVLKSKMDEEDFIREIIDCLGLSIVQNDMLETFIKGLKS